MTDYLKNLSKDLINTAAGIMNKTNSPVVEPEVIAESTELEEANKANKAKSSAFRAGKKAVSAASMSTRPYSYGRYASAEEKKKENDEYAAKKDAATDKASKMKLAAKDRLRSLGKSTKGASSAFNKGKEVEKAGAPATHKADVSIRSNASAKHRDSAESKAEYGEKYASIAGSGENRGKFKQKHDEKQHDIIRQKISDLHDNIRKKLDDMKPYYRAPEREGSSAVDKAKEHLAKMTKIHASLHESVDVEDFNEVIMETLELVETVVVLSELYGEDDNG